LSDLVKLSTYGLEKRKRSRVTIQKEMSVIILLHYINEIKDYFTPSASGFLFESFLGGLIKNSKVVEDNSKSVCTPTSKTWGRDIPYYLDKEPIDDIVYQTNLIYYKYNNDKYPHAGAGQRVQF
jgi:hypothetical protein